ncbi:hypothetical protein WA026_000072 [Henosepilachna vigintioctopunctata]|uniref:Uncharacterized protein n=1 Tax=Henosepilachna vigintioctopunctata TaxID=420089 RepID=A0AAW1UWF3_9CUCU
MYENRGDYESTPKRNRKDDEPILSEKKLALYGITIALLVIAGKLYFQNEDYLKQLIVETKLVSYESILTDGEVMVNYAWKNSVKYSQYWLPLLCGSLVTYFTWLLVYLDSKEPGIQPPSPFSPKKNSSRSSGPVLHLNYLFAIMIGVMVSSYTYYRGLSIDY